MRGVTSRTKRSDFSAAWITFFLVCVCGNRFLFSKQFIKADRSINLLFIFSYFMSAAFYCQLIKQITHLFLLVKVKCLWNSQTVKLSAESQTYYIDWWRVKGSLQQGEVAFIRASSVVSLRTRTKCSLESMLFTSPVGGLNVLVDLVCFNTTHGEQTNCSLAHEAAPGSNNEIILRLKAHSKRMWGEAIMGKKGLANKINAA